MFLEPIRDGLMRTLETAGVDGVAVRTRKKQRVWTQFQLNPVSEMEIELKLHNEVDWQHEAVRDEPFQTATPAGQEVTNI